MAKPWMIITGATGFLGGELVRQLRKEYQIYALGRRSPQEAAVPEGQGIVWFQVDIGYRDRLQEVFQHIRDMGGAELLLHLAAYYDYTGDDNPEYERTNVGGTRNLLELSQPLQLRRFIYTSSVAACEFPSPGETISELTPPDAPIPYAYSKRACEEMLREYRDRVPSCIVRPAAVISNWCEYEPLTEFLEAWCSHRWNARVLGGKGESAVPYLHVEDLLSFFIRVVERCDELDPCEVLIASPDGATTHAQLYQETTRSYFGSPRLSLHVPPLLAGPGIKGREVLGRLLGRMPFERSWMIDYIDLQLTVDATRTRRRLDWAPNQRLGVLETIPTMVANMRRDPQEWKTWNDRRRKHRG